MPRPARPAAWTDDPAAVRPMLATLHEGPADDLLGNPRWVVERKYDGMRLLVLVEPGEVAPRVALWSRNGRDKTAQFPDLVRDLKRFGRTVRRSVLLDGEVVALDGRGEPQSFQQLAGRIHLSDEQAIVSEARRTPVALVVFDVLRDGADDVRSLPLGQRRARLEKIIGNAGSEVVRLSDQSAGGDGLRWRERAEDQQWEGLVAKDAESPYVSGKRSPAWRKVKLPHRQEFVVGGWTEPRGSRRRFGSLLLGYFEGEGRRRRLVYAGPVGSGYSERELDRVWALLQKQVTARCPFDEEPSPPEIAHWVSPQLVVEVKFTEWTREGVLRHPVYLGLRADLEPQSVRREGRPALMSAGINSERGASREPAATLARKGARTGGRAPSSLPANPALDALVAVLHELEEARRDGPVPLPDGSRLEVTNLAKVFWPGPGITKGELLRYYARVSPWLLPAVTDRPLVMKRFPNGVTGKTFYQQRAPDEVPNGVRVEWVDDDGERMPRLVGGSLLTLLYMTQLASISQDPWFSRVQSRDVADYVALDLDPMPGVPFPQVRDVARFVADELAAIDVPSVPKTSGSSGLHVYIPLAPGTSYEAGQLFCQIIATVVATRHPKLATVERSVSARGRTVYVDYLQNIEGKTIATAYSARASEFAGVSTPLEWTELDADPRPQDFTVRNVLDRFARMGNLWAPMEGRRRADLRLALERLAARY